MTSGDVFSHTRMHFENIRKRNKYIINHPHDIHIRNGSMKIYIDERILILFKISRNIHKLDDYSELV